MPHPRANLFYQNLLAPRGLIQEGDSGAYN